MRSRSSSYLARSLRTRKGATSTLLKMLRTVLAAGLAVATVSAGSVAATPAVYRDPLDAPALKPIISQFSKLMVLAIAVGASGREGCDLV